MYRGLTFVIKPKHQEVAEKWLKDHAKKCEKKDIQNPKTGYGPAIGHGPTYSFSSTSIGEMQHVACPNCQESELINFDEL